MASNAQETREGYTEDNADNRWEQRKAEPNFHYHDSPDKKLVIDMSGFDAEVKQERTNDNSTGHANLLFGSEGGGFLDILASVAASKLEEERSEEVTEKLQIQSNERDTLENISETSIKTEIQPTDADQGTHSICAKRQRDVEGSCTSQSKRANPRRLADYERFGFAQISRMSLNTLLRLFSEPDFDEMRRVYSYKCYFMPDGICREIVQSFGNEAKAKAQMKNHLQGHIKETLKRDDYYQFTAEPVAARQKRIAQRQTGTNNNDSEDSICSMTSLNAPLAKALDPPSTAMIKKEFCNDGYTNSTNLFNSVPENTATLASLSQDSRLVMYTTHPIEADQMTNKSKAIDHPIETLQANRMTKVEPLFDTESGKENVPDIANDKCMTEIISTGAISYANQRHTETIETNRNLTHNHNSSNRPNATSNLSYLGEPEGNLEKLTMFPNEKSKIVNQSLEESTKLSSKFACDVQILNIGSKLENSDDTIKLEKYRDGELRMATNEGNNLIEVATDETITTMQNLRSYISEDHCYSVLHKLEAPVTYSNPDQFSNDTHVEKFEIMDRMADSNDGINCVNKQNTQRRESDSVKQQIMPLQEPSSSDRQDNGQVFIGDADTLSYTKEQNDPSYVLSLTTASNEASNSSWQYVPSSESDINVVKQYSTENGAQVIQERPPLISYSNQSYASTSTAGPILNNTSNSVPISPITITSIPFKGKSRARPASASGFSARAEPKLINQQADKEKYEALQAIRELQAKGATTEDLSCHICQPSKCFTAYTTLLSHLRSHAGIRKYSYF